MSRKDQKNRAPQQQRAAKQSAGSRRRKRRRTGKKTLHYLLLAVFLLAAGVVLSQTVLFKIGSIDVIGSDRYTPSEIIAASGIEEGENLFHVSHAETEDRLLAEFPYIDSITLHRRLPPAIRIEVKQSVAACAVADGNDILLITREGKVLERGSVLIPPDIPVIKGLDTERAKPGEMLSENAREGLVMLNYLLDAMEETGFTSITNLDITDPLDMKVIYENRILLRLGSEADLAYKLEFFQAVLASERIGPNAMGIVDATNARDKQVRFRPADIHAEKELLENNRAQSDLEDVDDEENGQAPEGDDIDD